MSKKVNRLNYKTHKDALEEAKEVVNLERTGKQLGLATRFNQLNIATGKYFRFGYIYFFAGLSGHGKSTIVKLIESDFLNKEINGECVHKFIILKFCFEMRASDEIIREVSSVTGKSYNYIISSERENDSYNNVTDAEFTTMFNEYEQHTNEHIIYIEEPGNVVQIYETIKYFYDVYNPKGVKLVITLDHTLLVNRLNETNDLELMGNLAKMFIIVKKVFKAMTIIVGQLNNNIEDVKRLKDASLHFPMKSDIYAQAQVYNAVDDAFIIHRPELLNIASYSLAKKSTKGLVHLLKLKGRFGRTGSIWLKEAFAQGTLLENFGDVETDEIINKMS